MRFAKKFCTVNVCTPLRLRCWVTTYVHAMFYEKEPANANLGGLEVIAGEWQQ